MQDTRGDVHAIFRPTVQRDGASATGWLLGFLLFEIACQLALAIVPLVLPAIGAAIRVPLRAAGFAASIGLVFLLPRRSSLASRFHPALPAAACALAIVALGVFHPHSNTMRADIATIAMYAAILAPLAWVGRLSTNTILLRRVVIVLWAFSSLSALVGTIQILRPDWQWLTPNLSSVIQNREDAGDTLKISLASGEIVFRPMGLSDQPGAASMAGLTTIVFGAALLASWRRPSLWLLAIGSMSLGLFCILLSQMRSVLVMAGVCLIAFLFVMMRERQWRTVARVSAALVMTIFIGAIFAITVGGESVTDRLATLVRDDPREIYYQNRGHFLEYTFQQVLPDQPLGAGLGRWGMINYYFGAADLPNSDPLWSEIMWTSWAYDGGVPLMLASVAAILIAIWQAWKIATRNGDDEMRIWSAVIFAFNIGAFAMTFNYPFFMGQGGLDFWLLNAALFGATQSRRIAASREISPTPLLLGTAA